MRTEIALVIAVVFAFSLSRVLMFLGYDYLLQPIGLVFLAVGVFDILRTLRRKIRKAGGWQKYRRQLEEENKRGIVV